MDPQETRRDLNTGDYVNKVKNGLRLHAKQPTAKQEYVRRTEVVIHLTFNIITSS
jgi:hypothetical protein